MKWTIFKRLTLGYLVIMLVVMAMGGVVTFKLNQLNQLTKEIDSIDGAIIRASERLLETIISQVGFEKKYFIARDKDFFQQFWKIKAYFLSNFEALHPLMRTAQQQALFSKAEIRYMRYLSIFKDNAKLIDLHPKASRLNQPAPTGRIADEIYEILKKIMSLSQKSRDEKIQASGQISEQVLKITAYAAALVVIMGSLIAVLNTRLINRSILLLQQHTQEIAKGKFEPITNITSPPEIKALSNDFNLMSKRLRELDEMKIDFISHVSHELRTPLTAIREASSMLLEKTYAGSPEKQAALLSITKEECERLIASVNRILDLSRMEANMMEYRFSDYCLRTLAQKMVTKLAPIADRKNVSIDLDIPANLPLARMDPDRIDQVLENLLGNALKFTSDKDSIIIRASVQGSDKKFIEVAVLDTGSGMAKDHLEKIFNKFHRIENGKETVRGTGLGLPIAKHIVAAHGGKIWAESDPGKWSTFFFTLPMASCC